MRLLTWNLNGRRKVEDQITAIVERVPDIVALQELTENSIALWREALAGAGMRYRIDSFADLPRWQRTGPRKYGLVIASRFPLMHLQSTRPVPWPERFLSATVDTPRGGVDLHTTHIPPGCTNYWIKVEMLEAVSANASESSGRPLILCGDFNVPQEETRQGRIITWGEDIIDGEPRVWKRWKGGSGNRWDAAERAIMEGGARKYLRDAFRHIHGYERQEYSWYVKRKEKRIGRRFDHAFCSPELKLARCEYIHDLRNQGLSDHSALELDFE